MAASPPLAARTPGTYSTVVIQPNSRYTGTIEIPGNTPEERTLDLCLRAELTPNAGETGEKIGVRGKRTNRTEPLIETRRNRNVDRAPIGRRGGGGARR